MVLQRSYCQHPTDASEEEVDFTRDTVCKPLYLVCVANLVDGSRWLKRGSADLESFRNDNVSTMVQGGRAFNLGGGGQYSRLASPPPPQKAQLMKAPKILLRLTRGGLWFNASFFLVARIDYLGEGCLRLPFLKLWVPQPTWGGGGVIGQQGIRFSPRFLPPFFCVCCFPFGVPVFHSQSVFALWSVLLSAFVLKCFAQSDLASEMGHYPGPYSNK